MALTENAAAWLALLERELPVPTSIVEKRIIDAGGTPHQVWLDFHDNYAGYHETIGPDLAVWGLSRAGDAEPPPEWVNPNSVTLVAMSPDQPLDEIICADAHPVHDYVLRSNGAFRGVGGPCARFEMKLERHGVMMALSKQGKYRQKVGRDLSKPEHQKLLDEMKESLVEEASDKNTQYYAKGNRVLRVALRINEFVLYQA